MRASDIDTIRYLHSNCKNEDCCHARRRGEPCDVNRLLDGEGHYFTVDTLAAALAESKTHRGDATPRECAAAIIEALKEAERE